MPKAPFPYPTPILANISGCSLWMDHWCWGLQTAKTLAN